MFIKLLILNLLLCTYIHSHITQAKCPKICTCIPLIRHSNLINLNCNNINLREITSVPQDTQIINFNNVRLNLIEFNNNFNLNNTNVKIINWENSNLEFVFSNFFTELNNLIELNLKSNNLKSIISLVNLTSLTKLDVSFNSLNRIQFEFKNFKLIDLKLNNNQIQTIKNTSFINLYNLQFLDLSFNLLNSLNEILFENLINLKILNLNNNFLITLPNFIFINCRNLYELNLNFNNLYNISGDITYGLLNLKHIYINNNNLNLISNGSFYYLNNLESLDLSVNNLKTLPNNLVNLKLINFEFSSNNITCNCEHLWLYTYLIENNFNITEFCYEGDHLNEVCLHSKQNYNLIFELGLKAVLHCYKPSYITRIQWYRPNGQLVLPTQNQTGDERIVAFENGTLLIKRVLRIDCGLYKCELQDQFVNLTQYKIIQLDPITFYRIKILSILAGIISAASFLTITVVVQLLKRIYKR